VSSNAPICSIGTSRLVFRIRTESITCDLSVFSVEGIFMQSVFWRETKTLAFICQCHWTVYVSVLQSPRF
jgi:hypothetical protein